MNSRTFPWGPDPSAGRALASVEHVQTRVRGAPVEPRPELRPPLEPLEASPRSQQRVLDGILGLEG